MQSEVGSLEAKIAKFLITYRTSVNISTGEIPSVLMLGRRLRTRLDLVKPSSKNYVPKQNMRQHSFDIGQSVLVRDYRANASKWLPGIIHQKIGSLMYKVKVLNDVIWKRHLDQIIAREGSDTNAEQYSSLNQDHTAEMSSAHSHHQHHHHQPVRTLSYNH
jgi:hypothetical protein